MRRIHLFAVVTLMLGALIFVPSAPFAQNAASFSASALQTPGGTTTLRRIQVNARTITALAPGKKYVVDLNQRGVRYVFDHKAGQIDFSRVTVRTTRGEVAISSFLETRFIKDRFAGFKYTSQAFSLGTVPTATLTGPSKIISCDDPNSCYCEGVSDCKDLINSKLCGGNILCLLNDKGEDKACICQRHAD